jgi:hypothetical protein
MEPGTHLGRISMEDRAMRRLLVGLGLLATAVCSPVAAQQAGEGLLNAVSYDAFRRLGGNG